MGVDTLAPSWTTTYRDYCQIGDYMQAGTDNDWAWYAIYRPSEDTFKSVAGMDEIVDFMAQVFIGNEISNNILSINGAYLQTKFLNDPGSPTVWDKNECSGRYYKRLTEWDAYPHTKVLTKTSHDLYLFVNLPVCEESWGCAYDTVAGYECNANQAHLFRNGLVSWNDAYYGGSPPFTGDLKFSFLPQRLRVRYFNPVVNELSAYVMPTTGGTEVVITGLGFDNVDAELSDSTNNSYVDIPAGGWDDEVTHIDFIGLQGQGTVTLTNAGADFTVDSNTQITIAAATMTGEAPWGLGLYEVKLRKENLNAHIGSSPYGYAGDWQCDAGGRVYEGTRFQLLVSNTFTEKDRRGKRPVYLARVDFYQDDGKTTTRRRYAPEDVICPDKFYSGKMVTLGDITRSMQDGAGSIEQSDATLHLDNTDKEFSILLADHLFKNSKIELYLAWEEEPEAWKRKIFNGIIANYPWGGKDINFSLKDMSSKYFTYSAIRAYCTENEYPNIHADFKGYPMPEVLGHATITEGEHLGAVQAIPIDTTAYQYLAAYGPLKEIEEVYGDDVVISDTLYEIYYSHGGRTYIQFDEDQANKKITFNCKGYFFEGWDSDDGYIQNPAHIMAYFMLYVAQFPIARLQLEAFDEVADFLVDQSRDTSGYYISQKYTSQDDEPMMDEVLAELHWSWGTSGNFTIDGVYSISIKDLSNPVPTNLIFGQVDCLGDVEHNPGLDKLINIGKARFGYVPTHDLWQGARQAKDIGSIDDFRVEVEAQNPFDFPWTTDEDFVLERLLEEIYKRSYGFKKVGFEVPVHWFDILDINDEFKLQDLYGEASDGLGEAGLDCYVESIALRPPQDSLSIGAVDMSWIADRLYFEGALLHYEEQSLIYD